MGEVKVPVPADKKPITRRKPGFRKVLITVTEEQGKRLDELALADDRRGKATEMLTILVKRNFDALIKTAQPVQTTMFEVAPRR